VGCLGYWLAAGKPPYWQLGSDDARIAQVEAPRAPLEPAFDVPPALRAWLDAVLAKRPRDRFQTAADAARALRAIPADDVGDRPWRPITETRGPDEPTIVGPPGASRSSFPPPARIAPQTAPEDWRVETTEVRAPDVLAAGLALHGLRSVPLAGRDEERDALWDMLRDVVEKRELRVVVLDGEPGVGKSRLAEWLETRALELGLAHVVHATHAPTPGPADGLRAALRRHLAGEGLDAADTARQLLERIPALDADAADEISGVLDAAAPAGPSGAGAAGPGMRGTQADRHAALRRLLAAWTTDRPVLLVLDDAPWSSDSLAFVSHLMRTRALAPLAVCIVITARRGVDEDAALAELRAHPEVASISVQPLPGRDLAELVRRRLALDDALAAQVEERSGGNPLFAVQLVRDWVNRGLLVGVAGGLVLRRGATPSLPDDLHALWRERVDRVLERIEPHQRTHAEAALEIAAVLGRDVAMEEWRAAAAEAAVEISRELVEALALAGLAVERDGVLSFAHALLRESLERRVRERGRAARWHRACAAMLGGRPHAEGLAARLGHHLLEAGQLEAALDPMLIAAREPVETSDFPRAYALLARRDEAMDRLGLGADDPRRAAGEVCRAWVHVVRGALDDAEGCLDRAASAPPGLHAEAIWLRGVVAQKRGDTARAAECFESARVAWLGTGDRASVARCVHGLAECAKLTGDLPTAERDYAEAASMFATLDDPVWVARSLGGVADTKRRRGELAQARDVLRECLEHLSRGRNRHITAVMMNALGDIERDGGDLARAESCYRESVRAFEELASGEASLVRMNLALVLLGRGEAAEAREVFTASRRDLAASGRGGYVLFAEAGLLAARTACGEIDPDALRALTSGIENSGLIDPDLAWCFEQIATSAIRAGAPELAADAARTAASQRRALAVPTR
jgi:tetratricopeptide (TPR) repeat protein